MPLAKLPLALEEVAQAHDAHTHTDRVHVNSQPLAKMECRAKLKTLHSQQVLSCFHLLKSLNSCEMNSFSRMSHPLKTKTRLQCHNVLDFGLNPISNQISQNEFYEL